MATYASKGDRFEANTINETAIKRVYGTASGTGLSPFWSDCPIIGIKTDPSVGYGFEDDFIDAGLHGTITTIISDAGLGRYLAFGSTGATIAPDYEIGGGIILANDNTDNDAVSLTTKQRPFKIVNTAGDLWFEARAKISSVTTEVLSFAIGLMDGTAQTAIVPMIANTGALANINFVGFLKLNAATTSVLSTYKADGQTEQTVNTSVALSTNYIKYGMKYSKSSNTLTYYIDGSPLATTVTSANIAAATFPSDVTLAPIIAIHNGTNAVSTITLDWWKCYQTR